LASSTRDVRPTVPRRRFGLRFSLRAFLGGVTIFCIVLAWQLHRAKQQREAVAGIRAAGGWVYYDYQRPNPRAATTDPNAQPWEPKWLLALVGIDFFHSVEEVNMVYNEDGPQRLDNNQPAVNIAPHLAHFPRLRCLLLSGKCIDDAGMETVGRLKRLETLYQWDGQHITDAGVAHLRDMPRLTYIHLGMSQVGDRGMETLAKLPNLEGLAMQRNKITDAGLVHLAGHRKLKELWIGHLEGLSPISDAGVVHLAKIPNLEELDLQHTRVTIEGLKPLQSLPKLKSLMLDGSTANDYHAVAPMFPNCKVDADRNPQQTDMPDLELKEATDAEVRD
jgi:Leucine Rich repeat